MCSEFQNIIDYLVDLRVLKREQNCSFCGEVMALSADKKYFKCRKVRHFLDQHKKAQKVRCNTKINRLHDSIFEDSRLNIQKICELICIYLMVQPPHTEMLLMEIQCSRTTICSWTSWIRDMCTLWLHENSEKLGGPGIVVEIDESHVGSYTKGAWGPAVGRWVFGGYERGTKKLFITSVPDRTAATLIDVIKRWILPGTIIISDRWPGYHSLNSQGFNHLQVNHKVEYVNYEVPHLLVHTQGIERSWLELKNRIPKVGVRKEFFESHLAVFLFKRAVKYSRRLDTFFRFLGEINE